MTPVLIDINDAAEYLGTSVSHMRTMVFERTIPHVKMGDGPKARLRFKVTDLDAWIEAHRVEAGAS